MKLPASGNIPFISGVTSELGKQINKQAAGDHLSPGFTSHSNFTIQIIRQQYRLPCSILFESNKNSCVLGPVKTEIHLYPVSRWVPLGWKVLAVTGKEASPLPAGGSQGLNHRVFTGTLPGCWGADAACWLWMEHWINKLRGIHACAQAPGGNGIVLYATMCRHHEIITHLYQDTQWFHLRDLE